MREVPRESEALSRRHLPELELVMVRRCECREGSKWMSEKAREREAGQKVHGRGTSLYLLLPCRRDQEQSPKKKSKKSGLTGNQDTAKVLSVRYGSSSISLSSLPHLIGNTDHSSTQTGRPGALTSVWFGPLHGEFLVQLHDGLICLALASVHFVVISPQFWFSCNSSLP